MPDASDLARNAVLSMPNLGLSHDADLKRSKLLEMALRIGSFGYFIQDILVNRITWSVETYGIWGLDPPHKPIEY